MTAGDAWENARCHEALRDCPSQMCRIRTKDDPCKLQVTSDKCHPSSSFRRSSRSRAPGRPRFGARLPPGGSAGRARQVMSSRWCAFVSIAGAAAEAVLGIDRRLRPARSGMERRRPLFRARHHGAKPPTARSPPCASTFAKVRCSWRTPPPRSDYEPIRPQCHKTHCRWRIL